jgi:hypothetical protein
MPFILLAKLAVDGRLTILSIKCPMSRSSLTVRGMPLCIIKIVIDIIFLISESRKMLRIWKAGHCVTFLRIASMTEIGWHGEQVA